MLVVVDVVDDVEVVVLSVVEFVVLLGVVDVAVDVEVV